jgi:hypothetical protein
VTDKQEPLAAEIARVNQALEHQDRLYTEAREVAGANPVCPDLCTLVAIIQARFALMNRLVRLEDKRRETHDPGVA